MKIYAAKIDNIKEAELERLYVLIDSKRREKILALKNKAIQEKNLFAGLLLRYAFLHAGYDKQEWEQVQVQQGQYGKPYIINYPGFEYSLSHSGKWVVCAADTSSVGVDIQEMKSWKLNLAKRFYDEKEYARLLRFGAFEPEKQTRAFYYMWTAKESAAKQDGRGIGLGISHYVTKEDYNSIYDLEKKQTIRIKVYDNFEGYIACACSMAGSFPSELKVIDFSELDKD